MLLVVLCFKTVLFGVLFVARSAELVQVAVSKQQSSVPETQKVRQFWDPQHNVFSKTFDLAVRTRSQKRFREKLLEKEGSQLVRSPTLNLLTSGTPFWTSGDSCSGFHR